MNNDGTQLPFTALFPSEPQQEAPAEPEAKNRTNPRWLTAEELKAEWGMTRRQAAMSRVSYLKTKKGFDIPSKIIDGEKKYLIYDELPTGVRRSKSTTPAKQEVDQVEIAIESLSSLAADNKLMRSKLDRIKAILME